MTRNVMSDKPDKAQTEVSAEANISSDKLEAPPRFSLFDLAPDLALLGVAVCLFVLAGNFEYAQLPGQEGQLGPGFWPKMLCAGIGVCAVIRLGQKLVVPKRPVAQTAANEGEDELRWSSAALAMALVLGYVISTILLGYVLSTALFLMAFTYLGGQRKWHVVLTGVLGSLVFAYVFLKIVYVSVPSGLGMFDQLSTVIYRILGIY